MGRVFFATHLDLCAPVAVKIVREELAEHQDIVERMVREARTAASFRSEHVARILDAGTLRSGAPFIVMEYLEGNDLGAELDTVGTLSIETAVSYLLQTCEAVAEAHGAGIVHRDLKPENLFLTLRADGAPIIKVLDFGISKNLSMRCDTVLTSPRTVLGSPHYMAPEQMRAHDEVDPRADIWSLGAVLYELLVGEGPFYADTLAEICARVLKDEPTPPSLLNEDIPDELESVILRCLEKDRDDRFESVGALARALAPFGPPGSSENASRVERVASSRRSLSVERGLSFTVPSPTAGSWPEPPRLRELALEQTAAAVDELDRGAHEDGRASRRDAPRRSRGSPLIERLTVLTVLVGVLAVGIYASGQGHPPAPAGGVAASAAVAPIVVDEHGDDVANGLASTALPAVAPEIPSEEDRATHAPPRPSPAASVHAPPTAKAPVPQTKSDRATSPSAKEPPFDPWDPKVFGGRR